MDKIKINAQLLGGISNNNSSSELNKNSQITLNEELPVDKSSEINNNISPITLNEKSSDNDNVEQLENNTIQNNIQEEKISRSILPKTFITIKKDPVQVPTNIVEIKKEEIGISKKTVKDLFVNYDSDFHKNEKTIMQRIRLFKMTPRTSIGLVFSLIGFTVLTILIMMKIDPENQSLDNYKASILSLMGKVNNKNIINTSSQDFNKSTGIIDEQTQTGTTSTGIIDEQNLIKEKWLTVQPDIIKKEDGSIDYIYKGQSFSKELLQEELKKEVKSEIDKKTKDYLNKVYIENLKK